MYRSTYKSILAFAGKIRNFNERIAGRWGIETWKVLGAELTAIFFGGIAMISVEEYFIAVALWILLTFFWLAKALDWKKPDGRHVSRLARIANAFLALFFSAFFLTLTNLRREDKPWTNLQKLVGRYLETRTVKGVNDKQHDDFAREFTLGYKLFGIANKDFFPFQGTPDIGFIVHWKRKGYSWEGNDETVTLHLPDIDIDPNMMMRETTVSLPNERGSSLTFRLDPKSFQRGAAIVSNVFVRVKENTQESSAPQPSKESELPTGRIVYVTQSTVRWGTTDCYKLGELKLMNDMLWIHGGELGTSRVGVFDDATMITGTKFIGGPRGGYKFPKAGTVVGNEFQESIFDASRIPDNAVVAYNRFISAKGVYRIGPEPQISFVVKIVQPEKDGAVLLFGAKPYSENEEDAASEPHRIL